MKKLCALSTQMTLFKTCNNLILEFFKSTKTKYFKLSALLFLDLHLTLIWYNIQIFFESRKCP